MTTECSQIVGQICERMRAVNAEIEAYRAEVTRLQKVNGEWVKATLDSQAERLRVTESLAVIRAENDRYRAEVDSLTVANANYEINVSAMWADYKGEVADRERYRAALVEITKCVNHVYWRDAMQHAEKIALNALAIRTESGPLSDDSGPIAEASK